MQVSRSGEQRTLRGRRQMDREYPCAIPFLAGTGDRQYCERTVRRLDQSHFLPGTKRRNENSRLAQRIDRFVHRVSIHLVGKGRPVQYALLLAGFSVAAGQQGEGKNAGNYTSLRGVVPDRVWFRC